MCDDKQKKVSDWQNFFGIFANVKYSKSISIRLKLKVTQEMESTTVSTRFSVNDDSIAVGLAHSANIYSLNPLKRIFCKEFVNFTITCVAYSNENKLCAISCYPMTGDKSKRKIYLINIETNELDEKLQFYEDVKNIIILKSYILIILTKTICLYDIEKNSPSFNTITIQNDHGAGDIVCAGTTYRLAICGLKEGDMKIMNLANKQDPIVIKAHQHPITNIKFNKDGNYLATSGSTGTIIHLFDAASGSLLGLFRRGTLTQSILSLSFSSDSSRIAALSASGTLHVFDASIRITDPIECPRAITTVKLDQCDHASILYSHDQILVLFSTGHMYIFTSSHEKPLEYSTKVFVLAH